MKPLIAVIDYEMGNLHSVSKALEAVGARVQITHSASVIARADAVVLPGVGAFGEAVKRLTSLKLLTPIRKAIESQRPFLGICLGLQLLFDKSEESPSHRGLGIFRGPVRKFSLPKTSRLKVPHMGWNKIEKGPAGDTPVLRRLPREAYFYFVHSFFPSPDDRGCIATRTPYGDPFCSAVSRESLFASQFHPEKSGNVGLQLLKNFVWEAA